jgi:hypothetical protein
MIVGLVGALLSLSWTVAAMAQVPPGWDPEEVSKAIRLYLESLPKEKMEVKGVVLEYKKIPGDPKEALGQLPKEYRGADVEIFRGQIKTYLRSFLEGAGTLETKRSITCKVKKKKIEIPPGKYDIGIYLEDGVPAFVGIQGEDLEDPLRIPFASGKKLKVLETLKIQGSLKGTKLKMGIVYAGFAAKLPTLTVGDIVEPEDEEPGDEEESRASRASETP